jgi:hypothetical protein
LLENDGDFQIIAVSEKMKNKKNNLKKW